MAERAKDRRLRDRKWKRWVEGPDPDLLERLYEPALAAAVRYDRCCAYFSSSVLAAAARGFRPFVQRLIEAGEAAPRPAARLFVNEELSAADADALLARRDTSALERALAKRLRLPEDAFTRRRLELVAWLVKEGLLEVRVGVMRQGGGISHAKFGLVHDAHGDAVVFRGSGNESASALTANYEELEVSTSWEDHEAYERYREQFEVLWEDRHPAVAAVPLPEALRRKLIRIAPKEPPLEEGPGHELERQRAAMRWLFLTEAPYLPGGELAVDATAPVDPWPHQGAVIADVAAAWPEGRLLCDEVGMGKTIEALMAVRRLLAGRGVRRLLILVPAGLLGQWQEELREKGGLLVPVYEGGWLRHPDGTRHQATLEDALCQPQLLLSRELARTESNRSVLLSAEAEPWDLVILDEAHAARRKRQQEGEFNQGTLLLELLRAVQLSGRARGLLLLSATPMQTHPWEPWDLLTVLGEGGSWGAGFHNVRRFYEGVAALEARHRPDEDTARHMAWMVAGDPEFPSPPPGWGRLLLRDPEALAKRLLELRPEERAEAAHWLRKGAPLVRRMHRNTREVLRRYHEEGLLASPPPTRRVEDVRFAFGTDEERVTYRQVQRYVDERFAALEGERPGKGFVMTVYRRRAASSWTALRRSLERRREALQAVVEERAYQLLIEDVTPERFLEDDLPDELRETGHVDPGLPTNRRDAERELREIGRLLEMLDAAEPIDTKRQRFYEVLGELLEEGRRVLVFTEYYETLVGLRDGLAPLYGSSLACYSGRGGELYREGSWERVSKADITRALSEGRLRILLCTDAASEGLNLQAASALVNYDLPWNPSRVEQRIGRIDRIGQCWPDVRIVNLFLEGSVDERVYQVLEHRCGLFRQFVGPMQPVLEEARRILTGRGDADALERAAEGVDPLSHIAYEGRQAAPERPQPPPVTREDLAAAVRSLGDWAGFSVAIERSGDVVRVRRGRRRPTRYALTQEALEREPGIHPLVLDDEGLREIARALQRGGDRLPLVVGAHEEGAYRAAVVLWMEGEATEHVRTMRQLDDLIAGWDGTAPSPAQLARAREQAQAEACRLVAEAQERAAGRWRAGLEAQVEAARLRLLKELGRYLVALDCDPSGPDALNHAFYHAMCQPGARGERARRCFEMLGRNYPEWPAALVADLQELARDLRDNVREGFLLGKPLDAALADPRWAALNTLEDRPPAAT